MLQTQKIMNWAMIGLAASALVAISIQYPISTTFPIGGDAAFHISLIHTPSLLPQTWYPGAYALFSSLYAVPFLDWPAKFSWWMALGQVTTGITIGLLAYRLSGTRAAAAAIGLWAITPIGMTPFFEDATMPQLWSLPWIFLFYERYVSGSKWGMLVALILCLTTHPITAAIIILSVGFSIMAIFGARIPHRFPFTIAREWKFRIFYGTLIAIIVGIVIALTWKVVSDDTLAYQFTPSSSKYVDELIGGSFVPWLLAAIGGLIIFAEKMRSRPEIIVLLTSFAFVTTLLGLNQFLDIGFWPHRTMPYLVAAIALFSGLFLGYSFKYVIPSMALRFLFLTAIFLTTTVGTWNANARIYNRYESPTLYARVHAQEIEAMRWMRGSIDPSAVIFTTQATRHYEWIPVLTSLQWHSVSGEQLLNQHSTSDQLVYLAFFLRQERPPASIIESRDQYEPVYSSEGVKIFRSIVRHDQ